MIKYINLSSGLEMADGDAKLVRIQSTHLEQNSLWHVLVELDYQFLFDAAYHGVSLHDCGSRGGEESRAQWKGLVWIRWVYRKANDTLDDHVPMVKNFNVEKHFSEYYNKSHPLRDMALKKLRYVFKMSRKKDLTFTTTSYKSSLDGDYEALRTLLDCHMIGD